MFASYNCICSRIYGLCCMLPLVALTTYGHFYFAMGHIYDKILSSLQQAMARKVGEKHDLVVSNSIWYNSLPLVKK